MVLLILQFLVAFPVSQWSVQMDRVKAVSHARAQRSPASRLCSRAAAPGHSCCEVSGNLISICQRLKCTLGLHCSASLNPCLARFLDPCWPDPAVRTLSARTVTALRKRQRRPLPPASMVSRHNEGWRQRTCQNKGGYTIRDQRTKGPRKRLTLGGGTAPEKKREHCSEGGLNIVVPRLSGPITAAIARSRPPTTPAMAEIPRTKAVLFTSSRPAQT